MTAGIIPYKESDWKKTNADRIRAMSDEELTEFFTAEEYDGAKYFSCPVLHPCPKPSEADCRECWLDWLRQKAET